MLAEIKPVKPGALCILKQHIHKMRFHTSPVEAPIALL